MKRDQVPQAQAMLSSPWSGASSAQPQQNCGAPLYGQGDILDRGQWRKLAIQGGDGGVTGGDKRKAPVLVPMGASVWGLGHDGAVWGTRGR